MVEQQCNMPSVPPREFSSDVSPFRQRLIIWTSQKWVAGTTLRYCFMDQYPLDGWNQDLVREGAQDWVDTGFGLQLVETTNLDEADIRIAGISGIGTWAYLGRYNWQVPKSEPNMNYGWDLRQDSRGKGVAIHEFGHALGYPHEHQSPFAGLEWDREAVYARYGGSPNNWDRDDIDRNILNKWSASAVEGSLWDWRSIMQYSFGAGLILSPEEFRNGVRPPGNRLSEIDIQRALIDYPPQVKKELPTLEPMVLESLILGAGEQASYRIKPRSDTRANIQTIGSADTVLVLQEEKSGETVFVAGDDDSGVDRNSHVTATLKGGVKYQVHVKLFAPSQSGTAGLVMW